MECMTIPELVASTGKSRQTIHAQIRAGEWVPDGPPIPNKRGKRSQRYRRANPECLSEKTPKWRLFEQRCEMAGRDPREVLWLLLSKCLSIRRDGSGPYGDPDLLSAGISLVIHGEPGFLDGLFIGGGPPCLGMEASELIRRNDGSDLTVLRAENDNRLPFSETWETAKFYVGAAIQNEGWCYNCNPMLETDLRTMPAKGRVVMRARWHRNLPKELRDELYGLDLTVSTHQREVSVQRIARQRSSEFLFNLYLLLHERGADVRDMALRQLSAIKWLWFEDDEGNKTVWDKGRTDAARWLAEQTNAPLGRVESFSESWARRYQGLPPCNPNWTLVNRIFQVTGDVPLPNAEAVEKYKKIFGWDPTDNAAARPARVSYDENDPKLAQGWPDDRSAAKQNTPSIIMTSSLRSGARLMGGATATNPRLMRRSFWVPKQSPQSSRRPRQLAESRRSAARPQAALWRDSDGKTCGGLCGPLEPSLGRRHYAARSGMSKSSAAVRQAAKF